MLILDGTHTAMDSLSTLFTQLMSWVSSLLQTVTAEGNEILLIPVGIFVVGAVIGLCSRLIGR